MLGLRVETEPGLAEMEFGAWEGLTFGEVKDREPETLQAWLDSPHEPAGHTGESFAQVTERTRSGLARIRAGHTGRTVVAVSHVTPIKVLVAEALGSDPLAGDLLRRMELSPASVTVVAFHEDGSSSLRMFNAGPTAL